MHSCDNPSNLNRFWKFFLTGNRIKFAIERCYISYYTLGISMHYFWKVKSSYLTIDCVMTMISLIAQIMNFLKRFALQVTPFIMRFYRIVQVICVCVVILSSYLNMIQICIRNHSLFDHCINILNKIWYWYLVVLSLFYCSSRVLLLLCFMLL